MRVCITFLLICLSCRYRPALTSFQQKTINSVSSGATTRPLPSPDLKLYSFIHIECLTDDTINTVFLEGDNPLLSGMHSECSQKISLFQMRLGSLESRREESQRIHRSTSTLSATLEIETQVRKQSAALANQLDLISACVSLLAVSDEKAKELIEAIPRLLDLTNRISVMMTSFQKAGGWVLYPKSCENAAEVTKNWNITLKLLRPLTANFVLNQKVVFQIRNFVGDDRRRTSKLKHGRGRLSVPGLR
jgi:hypothetical protein